MERGECCYLAQVRPEKEKKTQRPRYNIESLKRNQRDRILFHIRNLRSNRVSLFGQEEREEVVGHTIVKEEQKQSKRRCGDSLGRPSLGIACQPQRRETPALLPMNHCLEVGLLYAYKMELILVCCLVRSAFLIPGIHLE